MKLECWMYQDADGELSASRWLPQGKVPTMSEYVRVPHFDFDTGATESRVGCLPGNLEVRFHALWSKAVGTAEYNKPEWRQLHADLLAAIKGRSP